MSGRCLEVSGRCLEDVLKVSRRCLEGVLKVLGRCLPNSALSCILSKAENLASSNLQDGAKKWDYFLKEKPPDQMDFSW